MHAPFSPSQPVCCIIDGPWVNEPFVHDDTPGPHIGQRLTVSRCRRHWWWPALRSLWFVEFDEIDMAWEARAFVPIERNEQGRRDLVLRLSLATLERNLAKSQDSRRRRVIDEAIEIIKRKLVEG